MRVLDRLNLTESSQSDPAAKFVHNAQVTLSGLLPEESLCILRVKMLDSHFFAEQATSNLSWGTVDPTMPISAQIEFNLFQHLLVTFEELVRAYPTSLAYDIQLYKEYTQLGIPYRVSNLIMYRIEVKRILHSCIMEALKGIFNTFEVHSVEIVRLFFVFC